MKKFRTKVITDESQVPAGFKRICEITQSLTEQKQLSDAHTDGRIEAVKLMRSTTERGGPVWVDSDGARRVLSGDDHRHQIGHANKTQPAGALPTCVQIESVCESLADLAQSAAAIERLLERLTAAVENIATQPKAEPVGTWRDMNGECH